MTMTTIGYGHFTPTTDGGKIFTVIFGICSIGIMGQALQKCSSRTHKKVTKVSSLGYDRQYRVPGVGQTPKGCVTKVFWVLVTMAYSLAFAALLIFIEFGSEAWGLGNTLYFTTTGTDVRSEERQFQ